MHTKASTNATNVRLMLDFLCVWESSVCWAGVQKTCVLPRRCPNCAALWCTKYGGGKFCHRREEVRCKRKKTARVVRRCLVRLSLAVSYFDTKSPAEKRIHVDRTLTYETAATGVCSSAERRTWELRLFEQPCRQILGKKIPQGAAGGKYACMQPAVKISPHVRCVTSTRGSDIVELGLLRHASRACPRHPPA